MKEVKKRKSFSRINNYDDITVDNTNYYFAKTAGGYRWVYCDKNGKVIKGKK